MSKTIEFTLDSKSIDKAIQELKDYEEWLKKKTKELLDELGSRGYRIMDINFKYAEYDGVNDVRCDIREEGNNVVVLYAFGDTALFIEFGTGVKYPDDHLYKELLPYSRGEYGKGKGKNPEGWTFARGEWENVTLRSGGEKIAHNSKSRKDIYRTKGNPANKCVYDTIIQLEDEFEDIARRVFND